MDPVTFEVVKALDGTSNWFFLTFCVSKDGSLAFGSYYAYEGYLDIFNLATGVMDTQLGTLSDWTGDIAQSADGTKTLVGSYGNSWYGKGGLYVVDNNTRAINDFYHQFGAKRLAVSPDNIFVTSINVDHHFVDPGIPLGQVIQGSKYHRGIEVLKLNAQSQFEFEKSFFLATGHNYYLPIRVFYKKDY